MSVAFLDLKERLSCWFHRKDIEINTGGKDINTGGGDVIVGAGSVDGVNLTTHVADADAHHNRSHALDSGSDHTGTLPWADLNKTSSDLADLATKEHHDLDGLADDDHSQYHNDTRGDARYYQQSEFDDSPGANVKPLKTDSNGAVRPVYILTDDDARIAGGITSGSNTVGAPTGALYLKEISAPGTPPSGWGVFYVVNGVAYFKNDAGTEFSLIAGA